MIFSKDPRFIKLLCCFGLFFILRLAGAGFLFSQEMKAVFKNGEAGYSCFRIPAAVVTSNGTILAFAEGRKNNCSDAGDIDLVCKRSEDNGITWSPLQIIWDDLGNTCGNPAPVVERRSGKILLLATWNRGEDHERDIINGAGLDTRRIFMIYSKDEGISWSEPKEITKQVKKANWSWYATGPCNGIQLRTGKFKGRLVIPCDHIETISKKYYSHIIYSDDGGRNWNLGGVSPEDQVNECTVAEISGERILLNMRNYNGGHYRRTAISKDAGGSWISMRADTNLIEPVCQASLCSYYLNDKPTVLAFSNPASRSDRSHMTVYLSYDDGKNWAKRFLIFAGPSAYSNLFQMKNDDLGCLFEAGEQSPYEGIFMKRISADQIIE